MTMEELAGMLRVAWARYTALFGEPPHGTDKQILAMLELAPGLRKLLSKLSEVEREA